MNKPHPETIEKAERTRLMNDAQNEACVFLQRLKFRLDKTATEKMVATLRITPLCVFERWGRDHQYHRVMVGPAWATVTSRHGCGVADYVSFKVGEFQKRFEELLVDQVAREVATA